MIRSIAGMPDASRNKIETFMRLWDPSSIIAEKQIDGRLTLIIADKDNTDATGISSAFRP